jgi:cytochrome c peroxidase
VKKLSNSKQYTDQFIRAFGTSEISSHKVSLALEQFMMTIVSFDSKFDQFQKGLVQLSESEERGRNYFSQNLIHSFRNYPELIVNIVIVVQILKMGNL